MHNLPMTRHLVLSPALRRALTYEAERAAPEECCGVLLGNEKPTGDRVVTHILPAANVATTARSQSYVLDPRALLIAERWGKQGSSILGIYHSHPNAQPTPSAADSATGVSEWSYLIISLPRDQPPVLKSYRFDDGAFNEEELLCDIKGGGEDRRGST